jgi:hypothetical protein
MVSVSDWDRITQEITACLGPANNPRRYATGGFGAAGTLALTEIGTYATHQHTDAWFQPALIIGSVAALIIGLLAHDFEKRWKERDAADLTRTISDMQRLKQEAGHGRI